MYTLLENSVPEPDQRWVRAKGKRNVEKFILFIVLYFIVVNFVLPRFGIKPG